MKRRKFLKMCGTGIAALVAGVLTQPKVAYGNINVDKSIFVPLIMTGGSTSTKQPYYVSPNGTSGGNGTLTNPMTLSDALSSNRVLPGDTIMLRGGTYAGVTASISGTLSRPITIKAYPGERAIINGAVNIWGSYLDIRDLEFMFDPGLASRVSAQTGSRLPTDIPTGGGVVVEGTGNKIINCVLHDAVNNGFFDIDAISTLFYGNVVYGCGWSAPDRGHGHGFYIHNYDVAGKTYKRNILFNGYGWGFHCYSETGYIDYLNLQENTCFNAGILYDIDRIHGLKDNLLVGGLQVAINPTISRNMTYNARGINLGYQAGASNATLVENYAPDGIKRVNVSSYSSDSGNVNAKPVNGSKVFVFDNEHKPGAGFVTVYNWDHSDIVVADLSTIADLAAGDKVSLWSVQAGVGKDIVQYVLSTGNTINIDMRAVSHSAAAPINGGNAPAITFPEFGCFILTKTG